MENENKNSSLGDVLYIAAGETVVAALTVGVFALIGQFSPEVLLGALLGVAVVTMNYLFLAIAVNRSVDQMLEARGNKVMTDEEAEAFAKEHEAKLQKAVQSSLLIRTGSIAVVLVLAFVVGWFNPIATVVPLLLMRPVLMVRELFRKKKS